MVDTKEITERMARGLNPSGESKAGLFGVLATGETVEIGYADDVYELLEEVDKTSLNLVGIAITTTGWAAPLNADGEVEGRPSEHAQRRRVMLVALATADEIMSAIRFADDDEVTHDTNGTGALACALREAFERVVA
jgi:hypothetical protein